jgi:hypothetical protein
MSTFVRQAGEKMSKNFQYGNRSESFKDFITYEIVA